MQVSVGDENAEASVKQVKSKSREHRGFVLRGGDVHAQPHWPGSAKHQYILVNDLPKAHSGDENLHFLAVNGCGKMPFASRSFMSHSGAP
jgi:hypothetical protein